MLLTSLVKIVPISVIVLSASSPLSPASRSAAAQPIEAPSRSMTEKPLWEAGLGGISVFAPDYPAAAESSLNGLPIPYAIYRGDIFRLEEDGGARIVPIDTKRFELGLSADAAFGADSDDNDAREGLPDLDTLFQLGPELIIRGPRFETEGRSPGQLDLALGGRVVFSVDVGGTEVDYRGLVFQPLIRYRQPGLIGQRSFFTASVGPIFATERLHDYFYEVDPAFALVDRPAFDSEAGYLGTELSISVGHEITERLRSFTGTEIGFYRGAANEDSPLHEDDLTAALFFGFAYSFFQSDRLVSRR